MSQEVRPVRYRSSSSMIVKIEVSTGASWEAACTMQQVREQTIRESISMLEARLRGTQLRIIGEPKVIVTQHAEEPA